MSRTTTVVGIALTVLLVTAAVVPIASALDDEQERIFFSDDEDEDEEDVSGTLSDPTVYAQVSDVGYRFTKPQYSIDNTSVYDFRRDQVSAMGAMSAGWDESYALPDTGNMQSDESIKDAHITYVGLQGGADPRLGTSYDPFVGESGSVLNLFDYRIDDDAIPDGGCNSDYTDADIDIDDDNETEDVYTSGDRTCESYSYEVETDRELHVDGETFDGGNSIDFEELDGGEQTLELEGEVTVTIEERVTEYSWDPSPPSEDKDPNWDLDDVSYNDYREDHVEVSDSKDVYVNEVDDDDLEVSQIAIEKPNGRYQIFLTFDDVGDDKVSKSELRDRPLWNTIEFGEDAYLDGIWRTYTMREHDSGTIHSESDSESVDDPPHPLGQYLIANDRNVTATTAEGSDSTIRVVASSNATFENEGSSHGDVDLASKEPVFFTQITVADAPEPASSYTTVHGEQYDIATDEGDENYHEVTYRRPDVSITSPDDDEIRVRVLDPETGDPLVGRQVSLSGTTDDGTKTTNETGYVSAEPDRVLVSATVNGDSWATLDPDAEFYYSRASASRSFTNEIELMQRTYELVQMLVFVTPLVFVYFYVRHFQFLE